MRSTLRLLPDLPSATIKMAYAAPARVSVAVTPRSPIGYNYLSSPEALSCGYSPISHRYNATVAMPRRHNWVAVTPRSPIGYNSSTRVTVAEGCGYSPISHRLQ